MNRDNVAIVLVRPGSPGNIGATARAMKNMGFRTLRLVAPVNWRDREEFQQEAERMAWNAVDVLHAARIFDTVEDAVGDLHWIVGTSVKDGRYRKKAPVSVVLPELIELTESNKVGILFGPESRGLNTREISVCQHLMSIPTAVEYPTLNLSQSVLLVCYHFMNYVPQPQEAITQIKWSTQAQRRDLWKHAERVLMDIGFLNKQNPFHVLEILNTICGRAGLSEGEVRTLRGLLRQIDWAAHRGTPPLY